jgi:opacity protein-like surface antigen
VNRLLRGTVTVITVAGAHCAMAADMPLKAAAPEPPPAIYDWTGFYTGLNTGAAWGSYDPRTSTIPDGVFNAAIANHINAAGVQSLNPLGFTGGAQAGYNWQWGNLVTGIEGDLDYLHLNGAATTFVPLVPAHTAAVISSYGDADFVATLRPRIGWTTGNWLFYATGGLALTDIRDDFALSGVGVNYQQSSRINGLAGGYAVGGGIEAAITDRLSVKAEYLHIDFDRSFATTTVNNVPAQLTTQSADLKTNIVRVGFNYRLGGADTPAYAGAAMANAPTWAWPAVNISDWEFDVGTRTWLSRGTIGSENPLFDAGNAQILASRLVWTDLDALSGETYARVDHSSGLFVKGFLGAGGIFEGNLNDEDFRHRGASTPAVTRDGYSNELDPNQSGNLGYANIDLGYTFLKSPGAKLGAFVGYNYYTQEANSRGCAEVAGGSGCGGTFRITSSFRRMITSTRCASASPPITC